MLGVQIDGEVLFMDDFIKRVQVEPIVKVERCNAKQSLQVQIAPLSLDCIYTEMCILWSWRKW